MVKELKSIIQKLPDDMEVAIEVDLDAYDPYDGKITKEIHVMPLILRNQLLIDAYYDEL